MRVDKSVFKYIEYELYAYEQTKKEVESYKEYIIEGTPTMDVRGGSGISDSTASKSIKLLSSAFLLKTERTIKAIDKSLEMLGEKHKKLFELKYLDCLPWREVYLEMNISDRTYFRLRRELVIIVGMQLGLIKEKV